MFQLRCIGFAILALLAVARAAAQDPLDPAMLFAAPSAGAVAPKDAVHAELLADTAAVQPGRPFKLGVRLTLAPGWHVYWRTAGDVGQPTQIKWKLPAGFQAGPLAWPLPQRFEVEGFVSYGYEREVLLTATVTPPAGAAGSFAFGAHVEWLACQESCVPGGADLKLTLPAGAASPSPATDIFRNVAAEVPTPLKSLDTDRFKIVITPEKMAATPGRKERLEVTVRPVAPWLFDPAVPAVKPALYPLATGVWETSHPQLLTSNPAEARFAWPVSALSDGPTTGTLGGVLRLPLFDNSGKHDVARVEFEVPTINPQSSIPSSVNPQSAIRNPQSKEGLSFIHEAPLSKPLWQWLLFAFIGGLILNVMPCVLPVLSLKVLAFVRQAGEERGRTFRLGLAYTVGVLASFAALAAVLVALRAAGLQVGQGFQLQEPRFVVIMAGVVFALSLSLLGVYTIELPGTAVNQLDRIGRREGLPGAFLSGVLSTALATPCTAPYLGGALAFAFTQPVALVVAIFLAAGGGLAAPYLLLSVNPGLLRFMPRPGRWMLIFEQLMGFVMLGFTLWLLSVLGSQTGAAGVVVALEFLLLLGVGCWLIGLAERSGAGRVRWMGALAAALALAALGYAAFPERYLRETKGRPGEGSATAIRAGGKIAWEPFSVARVEQLVRARRTVFVDFTAEWCQTCKFNEWKTLETDRVRDLFARHQVVALKADWTSRDESIGRVLAQFGSSGVPLYVIFPAGAAERPRVLPVLLSPEAIERGLAQP